MQLSFKQTIYKDAYFLIAPLWICLSCFQSLILSLSPSIIYQLLFSILHNTFFCELAGTLETHGIIIKSLIFNRIIDNYIIGILSDYHS